MLTAHPDMTAGGNDPATTSDRCALQDGHDQQAGQAGGGRAAKLERMLASAAEPGSIQLITGGQGAGGPATRSVTRLLTSKEL